MITERLVEEDSLYVGGLGAVVDNALGARARLVSWLEDGDHESLQRALQALRAQVLRDVDAAAVRAFREWSR